MPLPSSGPLSISQINVEIGRSSNAPLSNLNEAVFRTLAGKSSGTISISDFLGKSRYYVASGGNSVYDINLSGQIWRVHVFTSSGTFSVSNPGRIYPTIEYLLVAGGGGGGGGLASDQGQGGGGGAGGVVQSSIVIGVGNHTVTVGGGGAGGNQVQGSNGGNSGFGSTAIGGGGGTAYDGRNGGGAFNSPGGNGGSGIVILRYRIS